MAILTDTRPASRRLTRRLALLGLACGVLIVVASVVVATSRATSEPPPTTETVSIVEMPIVTVDRQADDSGGSSVSMSLGWGAILFLTLLPVVGAGTGWYKSRKRADARSLTR